MNPLHGNLVSEKKMPVNLVCFGDSVTEAASEAEADKWPTRFHQMLEEWRLGGVRVFNRGKSGETTAQALERIQEQVLGLMPGIVVIEFGGNDANCRPYRQTPRVSLHEYESNLGEMHRLVREAGGSPFYLAIHEPLPDRRPEGQVKYIQGNGATYAENFAPYRQAMKQFAGAHDAPFLDIFESLKAAHVPLNEILVADGIHLNRRGNRFYAETIANWMRPYLDEMVP